jgi:hypothetical protein
MATPRKKLYYPVNITSAFAYNTLTVLDTFTVTQSTAFAASAREAYGSALTALKPSTSPGTNSKVKNAVTAWFQPMRGNYYSVAVNFYVDFISPYTATTTVNPDIRKDFKVRLRGSAPAAGAATRNVQGRLFVTRNHSIEV